jgi:hypothetical protein
MLTPIFPAELNQRRRNEGLLDVILGFLAIS